MSVAATTASMKAMAKLSFTPFILLLIFFFFLSYSSSHPHPLDPLSPSEISLVRSVITSSPLNLSTTLTFHYVGLDEPDKSSILSWSFSSSAAVLPPRRAFIIVRSGHQTHELIVDITGAYIASHSVPNGPAYPTLTIEEELAAGLLPMNYTPFVESARKRRVKLDDIVCTAYTRGWFGEAAAKGRRVVSVLCYVAGETANLYARPLEGIKVVVDLDEMRIVEYEDREVVPVPAAEGTDYRAAKQLPPFGPRGKRVVVEQPEGKGFEIDGHVIRLV